MELANSWSVVAMLTLGLGGFLALMLASHHKGVRMENRILALLLGLYSS